MNNPGLCATCIHSRVVESKRGSRFWLCELSRVDEDFPRYPPLPVLLCRGYSAQLMREKDPDE